MRARLPWLAVVVAVLALVGGWLIDPNSTNSIHLVLIAVSFTAVGGLLALRRPDNPIGWLFLGFGLVASLDFSAEQYANHVPRLAGLDVPPPPPPPLLPPFFGPFLFP